MKKYISIIAAFFMAGVTGCKKDYLSLETNPNTPSVTTPALSLSAALNASAAIVAGDYTEYGVWAGYWTTSGNYVPNQTINQYQITNTSFQGDWNDWFSNLTNYNNLQQIAAKDPTQGYYQAIAMIMKAYGFSHLVDNYNDVPYSQAFNLSKVTFPVYDKGPAIYTDLFKQLDAAIALIKTGEGKNLIEPGAPDIVFGGDNSTATAEMDDWIKFANTLKLRMALRVSNVSGFSAGTIMSTTVSAADDPSTPANFLGLGIEADSNPGYINASGKQNPYYADYGFDPTGNPVFGNVYWRANAFSVNMLNSTNDPRASALYAPTTSGGIIRGNVFGDPGVKSNPFTSAQGPGLLKSPEQNAVLLSGAESLFLQAEAAEKGYLTGNAQGLYEAGITASFEALNVPNADAAATTYYSQLVPNVNWATSTNKEQAIITQKWIALNGYFNFEGYNEYRRTGYPNLPSSIDPAAISPTLPTRLPYPLEELTTNQANLAKEGTISVFTSKIFWAK